MRFGRHFNDSVFRGPDNEGGAGDTEVLDNDTGDVAAGETADTEVDEGESDKPLTVREQLKKSIAEVNGEQAPEKKPKDKKGRFGDRQAKEAPTAAAPPAAEVPVAATALAAPAAFSKEAKEAWDKVPPELQGALHQAIAKREQDMQAGVDQLKQRYAQIDQVLEPHQDALRQMNATPAQAVDRMFLWFKALAGTPVKSIPALVKSLGYDWGKVTAAIAQDMGQQAPAPGQTPASTEVVSGDQVPAIPEPVKNYMDQLEQQVRQLTEVVQQIDGRFGGLEGNIAQQNYTKTQENLNIWSQGKDYFEEVRQDMAKLLQGGMIPLKPDGTVDLDTAYERAIYYNPEVRTKVLAKQQQADTEVQKQAEVAATTAQSQQVSKARRAAVSIPPNNAPSDRTPVGGTKKPRQRLSVRDSIREAITQVRDQ